MEVIFEVLAEAWRQQAEFNEGVLDVLEGLQATDVAIFKVLLCTQWAIVVLAVAVGVLALERIWHTVKRRVIDTKWH